MGVKTGPAPTQPAVQRKGEPQCPRKHQQSVDKKRHRQHPGLGQKRTAAVLVPVKRVGGRAVARDLHGGRPKQALLDGQKQERQGDHEHAWRHAGE